MATFDDLSNGLARASGVGSSFSLLRRWTSTNATTLSTSATSDLRAINVFTFSRGVYLICVCGSDLGEEGYQVGGTRHYAVYHAARRLLLLYPEVSQ